MGAGWCAEGARDPPAPLPPPSSSCCRNASIAQSLARCPPLSARPVHLPPLSLAHFRGWKRRGGGSGGPAGRGPGMVLPEHGQGLCRAAMPHQPLSSLSAGVAGVRVDRTQHWRRRCHLRVHVPVRSERPIVGSRVDRLLPIGSRHAPCRCPYCFAMIPRSCTVAHVMRMVTMHHSRECRFL